LNNIRPANLGIVDDVERYINQRRAKTKEASQKKTIKNVGLDVHKNSISISIADDDRDDEVRYYGTINNNLNQ